MSRRTIVFVLAALAAVGTAAIRIPDVLHEPFWSDEVGAARVITAPTLPQAARLMRRESTPPGWYFGARYTHSAGSALSELGAPKQLASVQGLRLLSVLFTALLSGLVVIYGARFLPLPGAALAGLLVATGYQFSEHGKELRAYALLALMGVVFVLVLEAVVSEPTRRRLAALAAVVAVGSMTHYFFLWPVLVGLGWLWLFAPRPAVRKRATVAIAVGLIPLAVWLPELLRQAGRVGSYFPAFTWRGVFDLYSNLFASDLVWVDLGRPVRIALAAVVVAGGVVLARRAEGRLAGLLVLVPVPATAVVWAFGLHVFSPRNLIVVGPFAALGIAAAVSALPFRPLALAATAAVAGFAFWTYSTDIKLGRNPYDRVSAALVELGWTPSQPVILFGPWVEKVSLGWYLPDHPRLLVGHPGRRDCRHLYAVIENVAGDRWVGSNAGTLVSSKQFPFYGFLWKGTRRKRQIVVAEVSWSRRAQRDAFKRGAFLFWPELHPNPPCLAPGLGPRQASAAH